MKVKSLANNQFCIVDNGTIALQSYDSLIVEIDNNTKIITVYPYWDYSRTTAKYRCAFMRDEGFDSMSSKAGFKKAMDAGFAANTNGTTYAVKMA